MHQFQYEPINLEGHSFRLLRLCKADYETVQCELVLAYLDDSCLMEYEALSYAWGGTDKPDVIEVNGCFVSVTRGLSLALRNLRYQHQDRFLWVDAVCIDQTNDKERGHQVNQMGAIYKKAEQVLIWLGPAAPKTNLVFDYMGYFDEESRNFACRNWDISDERWRGVLSSVLTLHGDVEEQPKLAQEGLEELLTRSWFDRVWIIQEVANARAARVVCGAKSVLARTFALFPHLLRIPRSQNCQAVLDIMPGPTRKHSWWTKNHDLGTLLLKFQGSQASEPRDKIYALLGIASNRPTKDLPAPGFPAPNYEKNEVAAVQDTLRFLLQLHTGIEGEIYAPAWTLADFMQRLDQLANETCAQAAGDGSVATVKFLLDTRKADPDFKNIEGQTSLLRAAEEGHESIVKILLNTGKVDPDFKNREGKTPLLRAAEEGHGSIVKSLLNTGKVDPDFKSTEGKTPLLRAAEEGHGPIVKSLLNTGKVDPDFKSTEGKTPLLRAAEEGHESVVKILLNTGKVDVNVQDKEGRTPLLQTAERGYESIVKLLLDTKKAAPDLQNTEGQTPLLLAAGKGYDSIVRMLLGTNIVDITVQDKEGQTPLLRAAEKGHESMVELLLNTHEELVNVQNYNGQTPLARATNNGHTRVVRLLVERGKADVNVQDIHGRTPLIEASRNGDKVAVKCLLDTGVCDTEMRDSNLWSPFTTAAINGHETVVHMLLQEKERCSSTVAAKRILEKEKKLALGLLETYRADRSFQDGLFSQHPLSWAAQRGFMTLFEQFLETTPVDIGSTYFGADPAPPTIVYNVGGVPWRPSRTPLILWAAENRVQSVAVALLGTLKADIARSSTWAEALLKYAVETGDDMLVRLVLSKHRAKVLSQDRVPGFQLINFAAENGHLSTVDLLLNLGMSDELSEAYAIHHAARNGRLSIVRRLLDTGRAARYFDLMDARKRPVLWGPVDNGNIPMIKLLLDAPGIDVDSRGIYRTPLSRAAMFGRADVVKLLLETHSVDPGSKDYLGRTPLEHARQGGFLEVVELLETHLRENPTSSTQVIASAEQTTAEAAVGHTTTKKPTEQSILNSDKETESKSPSEVVTVTSDDDVESLVRGVKGYMRRVKQRAAQLLR